MRDLVIRSLTGSRTEPVVTLTRHYDASPAEVWSALTEPDRLSRWLGIVERDASLVRIRFADAPDTPAEATIEECAPAAALTLRWTWESEEPSTLHVTLVADGDGTVLTLEHRLGEPAHTADYGGGWEAHLNALATLHGAAPSDVDGADQWQLMVRRPLQVEAVLPAPAAELWTSLTSAEGLRAWWWNHWDDVEIRVDARDGGAYRFAAPAAGIAVEGTYLRLVEPSHLAFTWRWIDADGESADEACDIRLEDVDDGCRLTLRHTGPWADDAPAEAYRQGWEFVLAALRAVTAAGSRSPSIPAGDRR